MAAGAVRYGFKIDKGLSQTYQVEHVVASGGTATISQGSPTKTTVADASIVGAVLPMVTGDGSVTAMRFAGIAKTTSTDTTATAGIVDTWVPVAGLLYRGFALTATDVNTQAKINALMGKRVVFDLTALVWTVSVSAADALVNCVVICGGVYRTSEVLFYYSDKGTMLDTSTSM